MSATYNSALPTDRDFVRFLTGDTDVSDAQLQDEELDAVIADEMSQGKSGLSLKYFSAARVLGVLLIKWSTAGRGVTEIQIGSLDILEGVTRPTLEAIQAKITEYHQRGVFLSEGKKNIRVYGVSRTRSLFPYYPFLR